MNKEKISFKDLSTSLKVLVVLGWIGVGYNVVMFIIGFILGVLSY